MGFPVSFIPPSRAMILRLVARMGVPLRTLLREKARPWPNRASAILP